MKKMISLLLIIALLLTNNVMVAYADITGTELAEIKAVDGLIPVYNGNKWGYIDTQGKYVIKPVYDSAKSFYKGVAEVTKNGETYYIDRNENVLIDYGESLDFIDDIAVVNRNGKYGYMYIKGYYVIKPKFDGATNFSQGVAFVYNKNLKKYALTDKKGSLITEYIYDGYDEKCISQNSKLLGVKTSGKWGAVDRTGKYIIDALYDNKLIFEDNYVVIVMNGKKGLLNISGQALLMPVFDDIILNSIKNGVIIIKMNNKYGAYNTYGKKIIDIKYDLIDEFKEGIGYIEVDSKYGFVDQSGNIIIPVKYPIIKGKRPYFQKGFVAINNNNRWALFGKGNQITDFCFDKIDESNNLGIRVALSEGKYSYINTNGYRAIGITFDDAKMIIGNQAVVAEKGKYGIIDSTGKYILKPKYANIESLTEKNIYKYTNNNKVGILNNKGEVKVRERFSDIRIYKEINNNIIVETDTGNKVLYGVLNSYGDEKIPIKYETIIDIGSNLFLAELSGKYYILNSEGKEIYNSKIKK